MEKEEVASLSVQPLFGPLSKYLFGICQVVKVVKDQVATDQLTTGQFIWAYAMFPKVIQYLLGVLFNVFDTVARYLDDGSVPPLIIGFRMFACSHV